jgi:hypothetical protein
MIITPEEQHEFFINYYSYDILFFFNNLKEKYGDLNLLNKCTNKSSSEFMELLETHINLKKMYTNHLKS